MKDSRQRANERTSVNTLSFIECIWNVMHFEIDENLDGFEENQRKVDWNQLLLFEHSVEPFE